MISKSEVQEKYQKYSGDYDFAVKLYRLLGLRIQAYRSHAVELLNLKRGDCVVELGCGTGLNFPLLFQAECLSSLILKGRSDGRYGCSGFLSG